MSKLSVATHAVIWYVFRRTAVELNAVAQRLCGLLLVASLPLCMFYWPVLLWLMTVGTFLFSVRHKLAVESWAPSAAGAVLAATRLLGVGSALCVNIFVIGCQLCGWLLSSVQRLRARVGVAPHRSTATTWPQQRQQVQQSRRFRAGAERQAPVVSASRAPLSRYLVRAGNAVLSTWRLQCVCSLRSPIRTPKTM